MSEPRHHPSPLVGEGAPRSGAGEGGVTGPFPDEAPSPAPVSFVRSPSPGRHPPATLPRQGGGQWRLGLLAALATFALDQATKLAFLHLHDLRELGPLRLLPVLELVEVWNRGISYGLFQQSTEAGRWLLVALSLAAAAALGAWLARARDPLLALSLGLILGGALGNAVDRALYGAVFDFVRLHWGAWSWYVFNVADAAIVFGVAGLLYDGLVAERR